MNDKTQQAFKALGRLVVYMYGTGAEIRLNFCTIHSTFSASIFSRGFGPDSCEMEFEGGGGESSTIIGAFQHLVMRTMDRANDCYHADFEVFNMYHEVLVLLGTGALSVEDVTSKGPIGKERELLREGNRMGVIKSIRARCNLGLADAKGVHDRWELSEPVAVKFHREKHNDN